MPDPEKNTQAEPLQRDFLALIANEIPEVLKDLHDDVLPKYRAFVEQTRSKEVGRLLTSAIEAVTTGAECSEEPPSAILESLMGVLPMVGGLEAFQGAFGDWYGQYHLPDAWARDEALERLKAWVLYPETEVLAPRPKEDWRSWWSKLEAEQRRRIAKIKEKAESDDQSKSDKKWYRKEQRYLEKELKEARKRVKENKKIVREKGVPRYRWVLPPSPPTIPPKPVPIRVTQSVYESEPFQYLLRHGGVYETWDDIDRDGRIRLQRGAHGPPYSDIRTEALFGGLEPSPGTRESSFGDPLMWVVQHQVLEWSYKRVTAENQVEKNQKKEKDKPSRDHVAETIRDLATAMGLTLRPTQGRRAAKP